MRFRATVELNGKTATGVQVPEDVVTRLGSRKPAVTVVLNGYTYRSSVGSMGGRYMLPISAEVRAGAKVAAGDEVDVDLELDTAPRVVTVPEDLAVALAAEPEALTFFDSLAYSHRLRWVLSVESAKTPETRERRVLKAVESLREGRR